LKKLKKNPYGSRSLPYIPPCSGEGDYTPPPAHAAPTGLDSVYGASYGDQWNSYPLAAASMGPGPVNRWVMLPTLEEFGVRRPLNAPMEDKGPTVGGVEWPMMSRTMHHVRIDCIASPLCETINGAKLIFVGLDRSCEGREPVSNPGEWSSEGLATEVPRRGRKCLVCRVIEQ